MKSINIFLLIIIFLFSFLSFNSCNNPISSLPSDSSQKEPDPEPPKLLLFHDNYQIPIGTDIVAAPNSKYTITVELHDDSDGGTIYCNGKFLPNTPIVSDSVYATSVEKQTGAMGGQESLEFVGIDKDGLSDSKLVIVHYGVPGIILTTPASGRFIHDDDPLTLDFTLGDGTDTTLHRYYDTVDVFINYNYRGSVQPGDTYYEYETSNMSGNVLIRFEYYEQGHLVGKVATSLFGI